MKVPLEYAYWQAMITSMSKPRVPLTGDVPAQRQIPSRGLDVISAWKGIEDNLADMDGKLTGEKARQLGDSSPSEATSTAPVPGSTRYSWVGSSGSARKPS